MKTNKKDKNQIIMLIVALVIAFIVMIITAFFIANAIKGNNFNNKDKSPQTSMPEFSSLDGSDLDNSDSSDLDSSEIDSSSEDDKSVGKIAIDYMNYTSQQLLAEWNNDYKTDGYIDGGYTIHNQALVPNIYFVVPTDGNGVIVDGKLDAVVVTEGGKINNDVTVGMTYKEIKDKVGSSIKPADDKSEEDCTTAIIDSGNYSIIVIFDGAGTKSSRAIIKTK